MTITEHYAPLRPSFPYTGSKWMLTARRKYPPPQYPIIIEPFAGSACYAHHYHRHEVILVDRNPAIVRAWQVLQTLDERVEDLPDWFTHVPSHLDLGEQELLGLWSARGDSSPRRKMSPWAQRDPSLFWSPAVKRRLAEQAPHIRHWHILEGTYLSLPDIEATWFVDAPYQYRPGKYKYYRLDYQELARWVRSRRGQVIVCEDRDADWLPFQPLAPGRTKTGKSRGDIGSGEVRWYRSDLTGESACNNRSI